MTRSFFVEPVTVEADPPVKLPSANVTVRLATSCALAWAVAVPVKLKVAVVAEALTKTAVRPAGVFVTVPKAAPSVPVKVSPVSVMVTVEVIEPSLSAASAKVVAP